MQIGAHKRENVCYNTRQTIQDFAFDASFWLRWNVGVSTDKSLDEVWNAPAGRIFLPWFLLGILQPHLNCGRGLRPLSFAANGTGAKEETR